MSLSNTSTHQIIFQSSKTIIYKAKEKNGRHSVIKVSKNELVQPEQINKFYNEYEILKKLDISGVRKIFEAKTISSQPVLVMEYLEGVSLKEAIRDQLFSFQQKLRIAARIAEVLTAIHDQQIIHKDLNNHNIIVNPTSIEIWIIDFEIATRLSLKESHNSNPNLIEGLLAYISPEQTGRMNRQTDHRSDLYSLGICLYELFTGELPFDSIDPTELVYMQMAKTPKSPGLINKNLPEVISTIIMKLLVKNAEDRYQSAFGLKKDLEYCLTQYEKYQSIKKFKIQQHDLSYRFQIPEKLYGRSKELSLINNVYKKGSNGAFQLLMIGGYSGVGKSSLVYEVHKPITENRGIFIEGKFDQYRRDTPYFAWIQAFNQLIDQFLSQSPKVLKKWKNKLLKKLGQEGLVLTEILPRLEKIIGKQNEIATLEGKPNKLRFIRMFRAFIQAIADKTHPLFIFIDDWQWADSGSIELLEGIANQKDIPFLMITVAFRDNEITLDHPFENFIVNSRKNESVPVEIKLDNLSIDAVENLVSDATKQPVVACKAFAKILHKKTQGNAFFLNQMLLSLVEKNIVQLDRLDNKWIWDTKLVKSLKVTDNVVKLMTEKIAALSIETQQLLQLASCIGNKFSKELILEIKEFSEQDLIYALFPALEGGYIIPSNQQYSFSHDRIQQAAYSLLPDQKKQQLHYQLGMLLWEKQKKRKRELSSNTELQFDIVNHLLSGKSQILDGKMQIQIANLCLQAGIKAKKTSALKTAILFFQNGMDLLPQEAWREHYELTRDLYFNIGDSEMSLTNLGKAKNYFGDGLQKVITTLDRIRFLERILSIHTWRGELEDAIQIGEEALKYCGFNVVSGKEAMKVAIQQEKLELNKIIKKQGVNDLFETHYIKDKIVETVLKILTNYALSAKMFGKERLYQLLVYKAINLHILNGRSKFLANFCSLLCSILALNDRYKESFEFGKLALGLINKNNNQAKVIHTITRAALWGMLYGIHLKETIPVFQKGLNIIPLQDDHYVLANIKVNILFHQIALGENLNIILSELNRTLEMSEKSKFRMFLDCCEIELALISHLREEKPGQTLMNSSAENFNLFLKDNSFIKGFISHNRLLYACWFPENALPIDFLEDAREKHRPLASNIKWADFDFYYIVFLALRHPHAIKQKESPYWDRIVESREKMALRAEACKENFQHKYLLINAIIKQHDNKPWEAILHFKEAIEKAHQHQFTHIEALAHEMFAQFYLNHKQPHSAQGHINESIKLYAKWGALAKERQLKKRFAHFIKDYAQGDQFSSINSSIAIDGQSLLKASTALSEEIVLSNLLEKMMPIILENAGANEIFLLMVKDKGYQLISSITSNHGLEMFIENPPRNVMLPDSMINYVMRTKETVIIEDYSKSNKYSSDPYFQKTSPKSVLCFPLMRDQELKVIFYFENNLVPGAFNEGRLAALKSLSAQVSISLENAQLYEQVEKSLSKQLQLTEAYSRFVPKAFIAHLGYNSILDVKLGDQVEGEMSVLFADIREYTSLSEQMTPKENFDFINAYLRRVGPLISAHGGFIGQYAGDGFMAIFTENPQSAVEAALEIQQSVAQYNRRLKSRQRPPFNVGIGIHTGSLMMGIIGHEERMDPTVISDTVNTASRLEGLTKYFNSKIIISGFCQTYLKEQNNIQRRFLGKVSVKGKQEIIPIYDVYDPEFDNMAGKKAETKTGFETGLRLYFDRQFIDATIQLKAVSEAFPEDTLIQSYLRKAAQYLAEGVPENWTGVITFEQK